MHSKSPKALIYNRDNLSGRGISESQPVISLYPLGEGELHYLSSAWTSEFENASNMMWSWAPLENMTRVDVYYFRCGNLQGMHIYYKNGVQRTIGECRVGLRPCRTWMKPSVLYWRQRDTWSDTCTGLEFDGDPIERDSEDEEGSEDEEDVRECIAYEKGLGYAGDSENEGDSEIEWNRADLVGDMHFWLGEGRSKFRVLPAGRMYKKK